MFQVKHSLLYRVWHNGLISLKKSAEDSIYSGWTGDFKEIWLNVGNFLYLLPGVIRVAQLGRNNGGVADN